MRKSFTLAFLFLGLIASAQPEGGAAQPSGPEQSSGSPAQPSVDKARVMDFFQNQEFSEAIEYLSPAVHADSGNVPVLSWAGYAYYMTDRLSESGSCFRKIVSLDSNNVSALHYLVLLELGESNSGGDALSYAQRLLALQPTRAVWWRTVGECWRRKNKGDSALPYYERAYELAPRDLKTVTALADLYIDHKQYLRADTIVDYALLQDSTNTSLLKLRIRSAYLAEDYCSVLLPGERLVRQQDPSVVSLTWLALSYYYLQQYPDCIRICDHMLDMGLDIESVYYYEARAYAKLKDYTHSNALLSKALAKAIGNTAEWYFDAKADNYEALKDYKSAVASADTSYYLFKDPITLYNCGRICESELHNPALAKQYYRRYLAVAQPKTDTEKRAYVYVRKRWGAVPRRTEK